MAEAEAPLLVLSTAAMIWAIDLDLVNQLLIHPVCVARGHCQSDLIISGVSRIASGEALTPVKQQVFGAQSLKRKVKHFFVLGMSPREPEYQVKRVPERNGLIAAQ